MKFISQALKRMFDPTPETVERKKLFEKYFDVFDWNRYIRNLPEYTPLWESYADERHNWGTYSSRRLGTASQEATKETVQNYIGQLVNLRKKEQIECSDIEILALTAVLDELDYSWACGLGWHPSPLDKLEDEMFGKKGTTLTSIINSLVKNFSVNPYETEKRIEELYRQKNIRLLSESWKYTARLIQLARGDNK